MNPRIIKKGKIRHTVLNYICCCKEFLIVIIMLLGIFMFIKRDECTLIKRDLELKLNIGAYKYSYYTRHTINSYHLADMNFIPYIMSPNYILGCFYDPMTGPFVHENQDPIFYYLNNYFWKTDFWQFNGNTDRDRDPISTYVKSEQDTESAFTNVYYYHQDKLLSWTILKYIKADPRLYFFTKIISTIDYKFMLETTKNIPNTKRYYRTGTESRENVTVYGNTVSFNEDSNSYQVYIYPYEDSMFQAQALMGEYLNVTLNEATKYLSFQAGFLNINCDSIIYLLMYLDYKRTGALIETSMWYCFNPFIGKTFAISFLIWVFFTELILDTIGCIHVCLSIYALISGKNDKSGTNDLSVDVNLYSAQKKTKKQKCLEYCKKMSCCSKGGSPTRKKISINLDHDDEDYREKMNEFLKASEKDRQKSRKIIKI